MKDNQRPWFKFYPRDWLSDEKVRALSFRARGVYMEIISLMWKSRTCKLPNDLKRLARMVGLPQDDFVKIWDKELMHPTARIFSVKKGNIQSDRLLLEKQEIDRIKGLRRDAARTRWNGGSDAHASILHNQSDAKGFASGLHIQNDAISESESESEDQDQDLSSKDQQKDADNRENGSRHYSGKVGEFLGIINDQCKNLDQLEKPKGQIFNPYQAVQMAVNGNAHPEAIVRVQRGMIKQWSRIQKPMGYWTRSIEHNSAKFNERDHIKQAEKFKEAWNLDPKLKQLIQGIGGKK